MMAPTAPMMAQTFVLKNMFDIKDTADPDFHLDIQEDVTEECSKFGPVMHCSVDRNSMGHVYRAQSKLPTAPAFIYSYSLR